MKSIIDIAAYILDEYGPMTTMKLEKLTYYVQAYCLSQNDEAPLFSEDFQAWVNGPVSPVLYREHRGKFLVHKGDLSCAIRGHGPLNDSEKHLIDTVCKELSTLSGNQLSERTHNEDPWRNARAGYGPSERCATIISKQSIRKYYSAHPVLSTT